MKTKIGQVIVILSILALLPAAAYSELSAFGPQDPDHAFPMWYQDANGLTLGPCLESNQFCHLPLFGEELGFNPFQPVDFPVNFPTEFAYFIAEAFTADPFSPLKRFEIALQASFFSEVPLAGDQVAFVSLSIRVDNIVTAGDYAVVHPYGVRVFRNMQPGGLIRVDPSEINLIAVRLDFETPRQQFVGPFLESADPLNKDVLDPITGNIYLASPLTSVTVTGSPFGTNFVRVERVELDANDNIINVLEIIAETDRFLLFGKKVSALEISPGALTFPEQNIAPVSSDMTVIVTNVSALRSPRLGQITVTGPDAADFTVPAALDGCSNVSLDPSASCTLAIRFSGVAGSPDRSATVTIQGAAADFSPMTIPVSGAIDSVPPVVTATFPEVNGLAPANMKIIVQFDDAMAAATINGTTFTVIAGGSPVAGAVSFDGNSNIAVFTPSVPLTPGVIYTATITGVPGGVTDSVGNLMQADFIWSFTGAAADLTGPSITSTNPANVTNGFPTGSPLTVTFSEPMLGFTINSNTIQLSTASGLVDGTVAFDVQTNTAVFTPSVPLEFGTLHTLAVSDVQDLAGNITAAGLTTTFTTNFRPEAPQLLSPSNRSTEVSRPVTLRWTRPADQDGDPLSFRVSVCNNASFIGGGPDCQLDVAVTVSAQSVDKTYYAGVMAMMFGLVGVVFGGGLNRRKTMMAVLLISAMTIGIFLYACGGGGGGGNGGNDREESPLVQVEQDASIQVSGLSGGITFFWKVEADDGKGGTAVSEVFTFSTQ